MTAAPYSASAPRSSKAKANELELRATSLSTLVQMVASGAGVTLLPSLAVPTETRGAKLSVRRFVNAPVARWRWSFDGGARWCRR